VGNNGEVAARIETNGRFCYPVVGSAPPSGVEYAWNLRLAPDGSIGYNTVLSDVIVHVLDRTHLRGA
jgi:hypothetical protein